MISKTVIKLFSLLIITTILASCVNNDDQEDDKYVDPVELTPEALDGTWEVYFFTKSITPTATNISSKYRYPEVDGFTVTFSKDGTYYESNIFGTKTVKDGRYKIAHYSEDTAVVMKGTGPKNDPLLKNNAVFMAYKSPQTNNDTLSKAEIPEMFDTNFAFRDNYVGNAQGHGFRVNDIRYYRNIAKAPDFEPSQKDFHKNKLEKNDLLGTWEFYLHYKIVENRTVNAPDSIVDLYKSHYVFKLVNGQQVFEEYLPARYNNPIRTGTFKIIDDVINMFSTNSEDETQGYLFWVKDPLKNNKTEMRVFDKYRNQKDVLKITEEHDYFRKIK